MKAQAEEHDELRMTTPRSQPAAIRIFCSCAPEDEHFRIGFEKALAVLKRAGAVEIWSRQQILGGAPVVGAVGAALEAAHIFVPLLSSSYISSDDCWDDELQRSLERLHRREVRVVPVLVSPCLWEDTVLAPLKLLPVGGKSVNSWPNPDEAWLTVAAGIKEVVKDIHLQELRSTVPKSVREPVGRGAALKLQRLSSELDLLSDADPAMAFSAEELMHWGDARYVSSDIEKSIQLYRRAIAAAPEDGRGWYKLAFALDEGLQMHEDALRFYDVALVLDPTQVDAHTDRSYVLRHMDRFAASIEAASAALKLDPTSARAAYNLACTHARAGNEALALASLGFAITLSPSRYITLAASDSDFESIRDSPEFLRLLKPEGAV